jgi:hypothetical protein
MMTRAAGVLALTLATAGAPAAADEIGSAVARWQAGVVCASSFGQGRNAADNLSFIAQTQVVPAVLGMGFGVKAQAAQPGGISGVTITVIHPPFASGGPNAQTFPSTMSGEGLSAFYYRFEEQQEVVPGRWTIRATAGEVLLYSIDFDVVVPGPRDGLVAACGG